MTHRFARAVAVAPLVFVALPAFGVGTPAGTTITNRADVSFLIGGSEASAQSNVASLAVAEVIDLELVVQTPERLVFGGATMQPIRFTLSNVGNGSEVFRLQANHSQTSDDFDPTPSFPDIFFDTDGDGSLGAADLPYVPGDNDPILDPDEALAFFLVSDIPVTVADGDIAIVALDATATSGTGTPGQTIAGAGDTGVDAVIGSSGGAASGSAQYLVGQVDLLVTKSATIRDPAGGDQPVSGAAIEYTIHVSATGTGNATEAIVSDPIPGGTTYRSGTLRINGLPVTDAPDGDAGQFQSSPATIHARLGTIAPDDPARLVSFMVTID